MINLSKYGYYIKQVETNPQAKELTITIIDTSEVKKGPFQSKTGTSNAREFR